MLPELPVPGPSVQGPPSAGQTLLYHQSIVLESNQYLSNRNDTLTARLAEALANTSTDDIQLTSKNANAAGQPATLAQTSVLASVLANSNPSIFHTSSQWAAVNTHYPPQQLNNGGYAHNSNYASANSHNFASSHNSQQQGHVVQPDIKNETAATGNGQMFDQINHPNALNNLKTDTDMKPKIMLNKMTKEDQVIFWITWSFKVSDMNTLVDS